MSLTMEGNANVSLMMMYDDESVEVLLRDGAHLQLSPCGCEFTLREASGGALCRTRHRTRFTTSACKEMIIGALTFRNTFASQPYLPEELVPVDHKKSFCSFDSDVRWPHLSSCVGELGRHGEIIIRSEEGRAALTLGPSGEDFSVEYTCSLSRSQNHSAQAGAERRGDAQQPGDGPISQRTAAHPKEPEAEYQSTTVVQQFSCRAVAPLWRYPLSLAQHLHMPRLSEPDDVGREESRCLTQLVVQDRHSHLPQALPLTCPSPHWHRWRFTDALLKSEHREVPGELVKVMWCHGITYRMLSEASSVIEVSPGDGSVIRSNGVLNTYFTHHKPYFHSGHLMVKELTYHLNNLPPDLPGQPYSVRSVVNRASRILSSYNKTKQVAKLPVTPDCLQLWKAAGNEACGPRPVAADQHVNVLQTAENMSGLVAAELETIKEFNRILKHEDKCSPKTVRALFNIPCPVLLNNSYLLGKQEEKCSKDEVAGERVDESDITDTLRRTSRAIRDIDALVTAAMQTAQQS